MYDAVMANWEGYEPLRQQIINEVPHYGNADPYADEELKWVVDLYYKQCSECSSQRSKVYKAGLYSAAEHVAQGYITYATPDGRKTGEPLADAISPAQGRDRKAPHPSSSQHAARPHPVYGWHRLESQTHLTFYSETALQSCET